MADALENIQTSLIRAYQAVGLTTDDQTGYPNRTIKDPSAFHAFVSVVFGDVMAKSLGVGGQDGSDNGFLQVLLYYPQNTGPVQPVRDVAKLRQAFKHGTRLESGGTWLSIRSCSPNAPYSSGSFYVVPVTISFYTRFGR